MGDPYLSRYHNFFYENYVAPHERDFTAVTDDLYEVIQNLGKSLAIADPLHFAKNARARVINHHVVLVWDKNVELVTGECLENILRLGKV